MSLAEEWERFVNGVGRYRHMRPEANPVAFARLVQTAERLRDAGNPYAQIEALTQRLADRNASRSMSDEDADDAA